MIAVGDRFIPRTGEPDEEIEVTHGSGDMHFVKRVRDGLSWNMSESTINTQWTCAGTALRDVADHVVPTPLPPAPNALDQAEWASVPSVPPKLGDGLRAIADMLDERERLYGPAVTTWERIARLAGVTTEQALEVMIVMKRERALFSPENPDHVRDQIGYLAILQAIRARS